jgi:glycosyltransferase involved in cell wall biosynthesis
MATVYDIADDLPQMLRVSPQVPRSMRPTGEFIGRFMLNRNMNIASKVSFVNTHIKDLYSASTDKAIVIPNGVDIDQFYPRSSESLRDKLGLSGDFVIGFVGTMREWVDFDPVFASVSDLIKQYSNIKIVIVGEEGGLDKTRNEAKKYGILERTIFIGTVPYNQVPEYISCMDLCLIPFARHKGMDAGSEGFCPLKLAEYLACEKPVISSQKTSMPEDIVAYASSMQEYKDVIKQLYNNPKLRKEIGARGRRVIQKSYVWSSSASTLEKVLLEVAA